MDNTAKLWDFPSSKPLGSFAYAQELESVAVTPDGTKIAGGAKDGTIKIWNVADGKELATLTGHAGAVSGLTFNSNGAQLISSGADSTMRAWDVAKKQPIGVIGAHASAVRRVVPLRVVVRPLARFPPVSKPRSSVVAPRGSGA